VLGGKAPVPAEQVHGRTLTGGAAQYGHVPQLHEPTSQLQNDEIYPASAKFFDFY